MKIIEMDIVAVIITFVGFFALFFQERYAAFKNLELQRIIRKQESQLEEKQFKIDYLLTDVSLLSVKLESIIEDIPEEERDDAEGSAYGLCLQEVERIRDRFPQ
jgi:hypothetical protein